MTTFLETFIHASTQSNDLDSLCANFGRALNNLGFDHWAYQIVPPAHEKTLKPRIVSDYPAPWVDRYIDKAYHRLDPVITHGSKLVIPFTWDVMARKHSDTPAQKTFFMEANDAGLPNGFGISMPGGNRAGAMVSASSRQPQRDLRHAMRGDGRDVHLLSLVFHTVAKDLLSYENHLNSGGAQLTERELQCLLWSMKGKSAWDIGTILHISEAAVRFHFGNIRTKLDVTTIREAVVKAYMRGLIRP